jgi:hypothetical protein
LTTDSGAPPTVATKYELVHNDGNRELVEPELRIHLHPQAHVIRHGFQYH